MPDLRALSVDEVIDRLLAAKDPIFLLHNRPDGDTVGSGAALVRLCRALGKTAHVACADPIPMRLDFIVREEEVLPLPLPHGRDLFTVDVASPMQLGSLRSVLTERPLPLAMIDHHAVGTPYCDHLVDGGAAAAGEMVFRIAKRTVERGHLSELPHGVVEACFTALSSDTGCFRFSNTTARVHLAAAEMMEAYPEMDTAAINHSLFDSKSLSALRAEAFAGANLETAMDGKVAFLTVSALDRADFDLGEEDFETAIDVVRSLRGAIVAFTVKENRDGKFKASLRSTGLNVAEVAATFGGGGHDRAAGCAVPASSLEDSVDTVLDAIRAQMEKEGVL
jgi:phosphoesterase RecJ-like protein